MAKKRIGLWLINTVLEFIAAFCVPLLQDWSGSNTISVFINIIIIIITVFLVGCTLM